MLLLAWLRGEPRVCSMMRIPSETEEDMRRPERERERLVSERIALENRIENLLCLKGITDFKPRLKKAARRLDELRCVAGTPLPPKLLQAVKRLMVRHRTLSEQLREIETALEQAAMAAEPDHAVQQIQMLARLVGLGLATATGLTREVFCRSFADRRAIAGFVGAHRHTVQQRWRRTRTGHQQERQSAGAPYPVAVGPRLRRGRRWRWLRFQPKGALSCWFAERTGGAKGRVRKIMVVALARKLLVALWRYVATGELPAGARFAGA